MKTKYLLLMGLALALLSSRAVAQRTAGPMAGLTGTNFGIEGTAHDFSLPTGTVAWAASRQDACGTCHVAHNSDTSNSIPLWAHATTAQSFTMYSSPTLQATMPTKPGAISLACLSCHDGTVGVNQAFQSGSTASTLPITNWGSQYQIGGGGDLSHNHPISFVYDTALATKDGFLNDPAQGVPSFVDAAMVALAGTSATGIWDPNGTWTLGRAMLIPVQGQTNEWTMECSSCHDVHAQIGHAAAGGLLIKVGGNDTAGRGGMLCRTCHIK